MQKIGFGGSCHWCTEAIFQSLKGVKLVEQGWIASVFPDDELSEAVVVHFDAQVISLQVLIAIHLYTHSCTSIHPMRKKYRSAIYFFDEGQQRIAEATISNQQIEFDRPIITRVMPFVEFVLNNEKYLNYYHNNPDKPFCQVYIRPKLQLLLAKFSIYTKPQMSE